jgi:hypothetical protein
VLQKLESFRLNFLLRVSGHSVIRASLWLLIYASLPTFILAALIICATFNYSPDLAGQISMSNTQRNPQWLPSVVFNPLIESMLLAIIIRACIKMRLGAFSIMGGAALLSALHSTQNMYWGLTIFLFFLVQSYAFFHAYATDFKRGYGVIVLAHAWHNASVLIALYCIKKFT